MEVFEIEKISKILKRGDTMDVIYDLSNVCIDVNILV